MGMAVFRKLSNMLRNKFQGRILLIGKACWVWAQSLLSNKSDLIIAFALNEIMEDWKTKPKFKKWYKK
jgi:hypothetical protein